MRKLYPQARAHNIHQLMLHLVFVTRHRKNMIEKQHEPALNRVFDNICQDVDCRLVAMGSDGNHVHLLVEMATTISVADLVQRLKGISSRRWKDDVDPMMPSFAWSRSYFAKTVGHMTAQTTFEYIRKQGMKEKGQVRASA